MLNSSYSGGADPTGAADSTAAFAAAATAAASSGAIMWIPPGTYKITSKLNWTANNLTIIGAGAGQTTITQATANTGVVNAGGQYQRISGLTLGYASQRPSTETSSICLSLGQNPGQFAFMSRYADLVLLNGQTGMANDAGNTSSVVGFSCLFENIYVNGWSQSAINMTSVPGQCTGNVFNNIFCSNSGNASASYPVHAGNLTESVWNQLNVEAVSVSTSVVYLGDCGGVVFNSVHLESVVVTTTNTGVFELGSGTQDTSVKVSGLTVLRSTVNASVVFSLVLLSGAGWGKGAVIDSYYDSQITLNAGASLYGINWGSIGDSRFFLRGPNVQYGTALTGLQTGTGASADFASWNNLPIGVLGPPAVPATTVAYTNAYHVHAEVYVTAAAVATTVAVDGSTMAVLPANAVASFHVPAGSTITLTYASGTPTWKWYGAGY